MQQLELGILDWIQANLRCGALDVLMPALSWTCNHGEIWIVLAVAVAMAFSRLYLYVHWPSDVLFGALVGAAAGFIGAWMARRMRRRA